jgi:hypothetical protein
MKAVIIVAAAALALGACGGIVENAEQLREQAKAAVDEQKLAETMGSAVDTEALEALARATVDGAVSDAVGEVLPAEELAIARAVIDEKALADGLGEAVNGEVLTSTLDAAMRDKTEEPPSGR